MAVMCTLGIRCSWTVQRRSFINMVTCSSKG